MLFYNMLYYNYILYDICYPLFEITNPPYRYTFSQPKPLHRYIANEPFINRLHNTQYKLPAKLISMPSNVLKPW